MKYYLVNKEKIDELIDNLNVLSSAQELEKINSLVSKSKTINTYPNWLIIFRLLMIPFYSIFVFLGSIYIAGKSAYYFVIYGGEVSCYITDQKVTMNKIYERLKNMMDE
jgi:hypothetical protein